jgi:hydroxymethylpyrimidine/phosphomethylpyrimidine kinase
VPARNPVKSVLTISPVPDPSGGRACKADLKTISIKYAIYGLWHYVIAAMIRTQNTHRRFRAVVGSPRHVFVVSEQLDSVLIDNNPGCGLRTGNASGPPGVIDVVAALRKNIFVCKISSSIRS